jgi:hypothetical protein
MPDPTTVKVRVRERGYWKGMRQPGEIFDIPEDLYSPTWMDLVPDDPAPAPAPDPAPEPDPVSPPADPPPTSDPPT